VSSSRTAWHPVFIQFLRERRPPWIEIRPEVSLGDEPLRIDGVLELRALDARAPAAPRGIDRLWDYVNTLALLEFKSRARPFRRGDLHRLFAYGSLWSAIHGLRSAELTLVLAVPTVNETLAREIVDAGLHLGPEDHGFREISGAHQRVVVAVLGSIANEDDDDLLRWFAVKGRTSLATRQWLRHHLSRRSKAMSAESLQELEGYQQIVAEILEGFTPEERLAGLAPEERLAGLAPEERLAGLSESDRILALPESALRALPASYLETLPAETRQRIRARLAT